MPAETAWERRTRREAARAAHVAEHGNLCELCGNPPKSRGLSEDHDHKTKAHRGWLCFRCNRALPAYVTLEWLLKAALYLMPREWATRRELEWVLREVQQTQAEAARLEDALVDDPAADEPTNAVVWSEPRQDFPGGRIYRDGLATGTPGAAADEPGETP